MNVDERAHIGSQLAHTGNYIGDIRAQFGSESTELDDHLKYVQSQVLEAEASFWRATKYDE